MSITSELTRPALPADVWVWWAISLMLAVAVGFAAGTWYGRNTAKLAAHRARKHLGRLFSAVLESLDTAQDACRLLQKFPDLSLSSRQVSQLDKRRTVLLEAVSEIVERGNVPEARRESVVPPATGEITIEWRREPADDRTDLPDATAFRDNLEMMLAAGRESGATAGVMLIKIDRFEHLRSRFGPGKADDFLQRLSRVVLKATRDEDLVCRCARETLGVLLPNVDPESGRRIAEAVRDAVRNHRFRLDDVGAEVLVTASFGYTTCPADDHPEFSLTRAGNALEESRRRGRNQLHVHEGTTVEHCTAG